MQRDLKWDEAWQQMAVIIERLEESEGDLQILDFLFGQLTYVLEAYYKPEFHDTILFDGLQQIREWIKKDIKNRPELFVEEEGEGDDDEEEIIGNA